MTIYCGVDFHARQQFIMWCDTADGEIHELQLSHRVPDEVREFYAQFKGDVIVGFEASGYSSWFETMLQQLKHQIWIGNRARFEAGLARARRPIGGMLSCCWICCSRTSFRASIGWLRKVWKCCGNCATGIGWWRCGPGSTTRCTRSR